MRFDENAQRISVNGRPKRIKMYAFLNENALGWTGPNKKFWFSKASHATRIVTCTAEKSRKVNLTSGFSLHFSLTVICFEFGEMRQLIG